MKYKDLDIRNMENSRGTFLSTEARYVRCSRTAEMEKLVVEIEIAITSPAGQRVQTATSARQYGLGPDG